MYERSFRRITGLLIRRGLSPGDAEDIAQEAHLRLEEAKRETEVAAPEGFVVRVALNLATDSLRRALRWKFVGTPIDEMEISDPSPTPDEVIGARRRLEKLREGLEALPDELRSVLVQKRIEGMTIDRIAEVQGISTATVERRLKRALVQLDVIVNGEED